VFLVMIVLAAGAAEARLGALSFWDETPPDELIPALVDAMTPEELIAQTLMIGWLGEDPSADVTEWIEESNLGGIKVFGWNGGNLPRLARSVGTMQDLAAAHRFGIPLLVATDQEGGWVRHVKGSGDLTTRITPGNMAIGASDLPCDAYQSGYYIGLELRALGINMNFAPTVDVYINPQAHVIGPRAFSDDPVQSGVLGSAFFRGMDATRVIATAKHFPGHGNASDDSHGVLPVIDDSLETLEERDLVPFRMLIAEGVPAILSGHLNFPRVTGDNRPASMSAYFKHDLLREQMGFDGLVITDDLYMGGAWEFGADLGWGISEIVSEALSVGTDMVMLSQTPEYGGEMLELLLRRFDTDALFASRIREAAARVIRIKLEYLRGPDRVPLDPDPELLPELIQDSAGTLFFRDQAARSVAIARPEAIPLPLENTTLDDTALGRPRERILLAGKDRDFLRIGQEFIPDAETYLVPSRAFASTSAGDRAAIVRAASGFDRVVFCLSDPATAELINTLRDTGVEITVFSILTPVYLNELPWVDSALAVFGWGDESFRAGFSVLLGVTPAYGTMPVSISRERE
jgi:beta-N-acetylhexosaminidase